MPAIIVWSVDEWLIVQAARRVGCEAVIARNGSELQDDRELTWTIGDQELPNLPEWQDDRNSKTIV